MADEFTISASLSLTNGNDSFSKSASYNADQTAAGGPSPAVVSVGFAAHEAITATDVTSKGLSWIENLDDTNFVEIGVEVAAAFYPLIRLKAGEKFPIRFSPSVSLFAKADTAAVRLGVYVFEA